MGKEKLKELAVVLFQEVRKNATIDWTIRERRLVNNFVSHNKISC